MKKSILSICFILAGFFTAIAQTGTVVGSQIRVAEKPNGEFNGWTTDWIKLTGNDRPTLEITEESAEYGIYSIVFTFQDDPVIGIYTYDGNESAKRRKEWKKRVVNAYKDEEGDYIYVEDVSLQQLAKDPNSWAKYPDAAIQFVNKDMNVAFK